MLKIIKVFILLIFSGFTGFSQGLITGRITEATGTGIPYVNIGVKGGKTGTVSNGNGDFSIAVADSLLNDSLTFSSIGYMDQSFLISDLLKKKRIEVTLDEKITALPEIKIVNVKRKTYKLGITGRTPMIFIPSRSYRKNDIIEQARLIRLKRPAKLLAANIFVLSDSKREVTIRLNFYRVKNGMPSERLIEKSILKKAPLEKGWFTIDLSAERIYVDEDFVVSFEYLPSDQSSISFGAKIGAADSFLRTSSLGIWKKNAAGGCSIYVRAEM